MAENDNFRAKRRSNKMQSTMFFSLFIVVVVIIAVVVSCFVFFKVEEVRVNTIEKYTQEEILDVAKVEIGKNLLFMDTESIERRIIDKFPYVESVEITKKIPFTIEINVKQAEEYFSILYGNEYVLISKYGKLLERIPQPKAGTTTLICGEIEDVDGHINFTESTDNTTFSELCLAIKDIPKGKITQVDMSNVADVTMIYDGRITMEIGSAIDLSTKIKFGFNIIENGYIAQLETGVLNLKMVTENNKAYFDPTEGDEVTVTPSVDPTETPNPEVSTEPTTSPETNGGRGDDIPDV